MTVLTGATSQALADLSSALTAVSTDVDAVLRTTSRAAVDLIGDGAAIRVAGPDGRYEPPVAHHPDAARQLRLVEVLAAADGDLSAALGTTRQPVIRSLDQEGDPDQLSAALAGAGVRAALLCPLAAEDGFLGYLLLVRTGDGRYTGPDAELAADIARRLATALGTARSVERLRAAEERYRSIVETASEGVWQIDADGVTTFVNDRMAAILGLPREQLAGLPMRGFLDGRGQAELDRRLTDRSEGRTELYETRLVRGDGSTRWVQISAAPLPGRGRPVGSLCMVTDITERVQARELKRQLDHLRRLDSLGQLVGGIAHDFKNLFTVIAGSAELIAGADGLDPAQRELATQIVDATVRGRALTHQLLAFGRGGGRAETIALPELLEDVQHLLARTIGEHIQLDIRTGGGIWPVRAERGPLQQALVNLAVNARDAMTRGGTLIIELTNVELEAGDPSHAGRFVRLVISDTGTGMDGEARRRAFEPFFTTKSTGAGLGLTTVETVAHAHGGHVELVSEPGIGTTVTLYLRPADLPAPLAGAQPPEPAPEPAPRRENVLVVEDQPELAQLVRYLLQPAGYTVTVVTSVGEAISHVHAGVDPDVLLTDVVMPGMTGPELAAVLRARKPDLRVLFMSGYGPGDLGRRGYLPEDAPLIQKPFNRDTLLGALERALAR